MDEADKLCDRIAIVDHGELKALDSPMKLKASIPGKNMLEVSFSTTPPGWAAGARSALPDVESVTGEDHVFRIASTQRAGDDDGADGGGGSARGVAVQSLSVQSTTLDDVFVHYTGRALRDALQEAVGAGQPVHDAAEVTEDRMQRTWAIIERELRRFRRSPMLIVMSMIMPIVQLVVLGYAFGGNVKHLKVAHRRSGSRRAGGQGPRAGRRRCSSGARTFDTVDYADPGPGARRPAQRPRQRRADDPAGFLAPRARRRTSRASR